jgi:hypothetical protein
MPLVAHKPEQQLVDIVGTLGGRWTGYTALCRCPAHNDRTPSLSLRQGDRGILVHCYAGCARADVLRELGRIVPTRTYQSPKWQTAPPRAHVGRLWDQGIPVRGTLAETYLRSRFLDCQLPDIRYLARCPHGPAPSTIFKPALLVAVRDDTGLTAIQRIFLDPVTGRHTDKVMIGRPGTGAWRGAIAETTIAITESFEDAAAYMQLGHGPCWTSLGAGRLHCLTLPASVRSVTIAEDNDAEGRRAAQHAAQEYREHGLAVHRMAPPKPHKDWAALHADQQAKEEGD